MIRENKITLNFSCNVCHESTENGYRCEMCLKSICPVCVCSNDYDKPVCPTCDGARIRI